VLDNTSSFAVRQSDNRAKLPNEFEHVEQNNFCACENNKLQELTELQLEFNHAIEGSAVSNTSIDFRMNSMSFSIIFLGENEPIHKQK